jgi:hypothetical protein
MVRGGAAHHRAQLRGYLIGELDRREMPGFRKDRQG